MAFGIAIGASDLLRGQTILVQDGFDKPAGSTPAASTYEYRLAALGFDWQVSQTELVATYFANAGQNGLMSREQVLAPHAGYPLLAKDPLSGLFKLTLGIRKSNDLIRFDPFPMTTSQTSINAQGELEFRFSSQDRAAFFRLEAK